jgi:hypothetical protein
MCEINDLVIDYLSNIGGPFEKFVNWRQCAAMLLCLPMHNIGALPLVHELLKRPS